MRCQSFSIVQGPPAMAMPAALRATASAASVRGVPLLSGCAFKKRAIVSFSGSSAGPATKQLVLYSKPGCCLCDGLKEKLDTAFSLTGPYSLHEVHLQVRDITTNAEWERLYQYEIPVLARVLPDGTELVLPRLSPRLGVELLQKKIAAAFVDS